MSRPSLPSPQDFDVVLRPRPGWGDTGAARLLVRGRDILLQDRDGVWTAMASQVPPLLLRAALVRGLAVLWRAGTDFVPPPGHQGFWSLNRAAMGGVLLREEARAKGTLALLADRVARELGEGLSPRARSSVREGCSGEADWVPHAMGARASVSLRPWDGGAFFMFLRSDLAEGVVIEAQPQRADGAARGPSFVLHRGMPGEEPVVDEAMDRFRSFARRWIPAPDLPAAPSKGERRVGRLGALRKAATPEMMPLVERLEGLLPSAGREEIQVFERRVVGPALALALRPLPRVEDEPGADAAARRAELDRLMTVCDFIESMRPAPGGPRP